MLQFTVERMASFRAATADAVNTYCRTNSEQCDANTVLDTDVVITGLRESSSGLQVQFYVQRMGGRVLPASTIVAAVQVNK